MTAGGRLFLLLFCAAGVAAQAQQVTGRVTDRTGLALPGASVVVVGAPDRVTATGPDGSYRLDLPSAGTWTLVASFVGYESGRKSVEAADGAVRLDFRLAEGIAIGTSEVIADGTRTAPVQRIDPRVASRIPSPRGTIEDLLLQAPVNFTSELSSGYNVRGGSFDENLVYVNGIEVYRPFLVRSGQQEGLSFPNPDMVDRIVFSAGGFEARYGDKLSSVLDITYRRPTERAVRATASLMGANVALDAVDGRTDGPQRWSLNAGVRYRDNAYVLGSLDETGEYNPRYIDAQALFTWDVDGYGPWQVEALGVFGRNDFRFVPKTRTTDVGNINEALRLTIYFDGREHTWYETGFGALSAVRITDASVLRFTASAFSTSEQEQFDILGAYFLDELDRDLGSDALGEVVVNRGVGAYLDHARNRLSARVGTFAVRGTHRAAGSRHATEWGVQSATERVEDTLNEWSLVDSAGYIAPRPPNDQPDPGIFLDDVVRAENRFTALRTTAFVQHNRTWSQGEGRRWEATVGMRAHHWTLNGDLVGGPRAHVSRTTRSGDVWKLAGGMYYQPPFYREMRRFDGTLNTDLRAQLALHAVLTSDRVVQWYGRPFKVVTEVYWKSLRDLVPYELENVRQRYYAENLARGYAAGADFLLNGEFISGIQSWLRLSMLSTQEDLSNDDHWNYLNDEGAVIIEGFTLNNVAVDSVRVSPGLIPRPTDQRFNASLLFQDEMPGNPAYKVLVSLYFGTGLPFGPPDYNRYRDILRTPPYRRVDIGFSRDLFLEDERGRSGFIALEIFNLLGIRNTINHTWIEDVNGRLYAISNYLTDRRVNLKVGFTF
jgi:hypothetical protein